jgi:hypothetical protein
MRQRPKPGWAGFLPIASVFVGAGAGGWLAAAVGAIEWPIALVGAVIGYLVSGAILRRVYSVTSKVPLSIKLSVS